MSRIARHFRSNAVAYVALFLSTPGIAIAAGTVGSVDIIDGDVATVDLADQSVTNAKLANDAVDTTKIATFAIDATKILGNTITSNEIKDESLLASDFAPGQLPSGPTGATGPQGPAGPTGPQGPTGDKGPAGPTGATGATGAAGPKGATGARGARGVQGARGARGLIGPRGLTGRTGARGLVGPRGLRGYIGPRGLRGAIGPQGPRGFIGARGQAGARGPSGVWARGTGHSQGVLVNNYEVNAAPVVSTTVDAPSAGQVLTLANLKFEADVRLTPGAVFGNPAARFANINARVKVDGRWTGMTYVESVHPGREEWHTISLQEPITVGAGRHRVEVFAWMSVDRGNMTAATYVREGSVYAFAIG
ncbi:MAG: collagen-like protein [Thermoleophilia bacterium]|nr:collagen-like protein [Thermoleophilia bacterium]